MIHWTMCISTVYNISTLYFLTSRWSSRIAKWHGFWALVSLFNHHRNHKRCYYNYYYCHISGSNHGISGWWWGQSLSNLDGTITRLRKKLRIVDDEIQSSVRSQAQFGEDGQEALTDVSYPTTFFICQKGLHALLSSVSSDCLLFVVQSKEILYHIDYILLFKRKFTWFLEYNNCSACFASRVWKNAFIAFSQAKCERIDVYIMKQ